MCRHCAVSNERCACGLCSPAGYAGFRYAPLAAECVVLPDGQEVIYCNSDGESLAADSDQRCDCCNCCGCYQSPTTPTQYISDSETDCQCERCQTLTEHRQQGDGAAERSAAPSPRYIPARREEAPAVISATPLRARSCESAGRTPRKRTPTPATTRRSTPVPQRRATPAAKTLRSAGNSGVRDASSRGAATERNKTPTQRAYGFCGRCLRPQQRNTAFHNVTVGMPSGGQNLEVIAKRVYRGQHATHKTQETHVPTLRFAFAKQNTQRVRATRGGTPAAAANRRTSTHRAALYTTRHRPAARPQTPSYKHANIN